MSLYLMWGFSVAPHLTSLFPESADEGSFMALSMYQ